MDASVVVPTHNRAESLARTLRALRGQDFAREWEIVVVDNASTDDTADVVAAFRPLARRIYDPIPSAPRARNLGVAASTGEIVIFVDDDIEVGSDFVRRHVAATRDNVGAVVVGHSAPIPDIEATAFGRYYLTLYGRAAPEPPRQVEWFASGNASMARSTFERLGGYDEATAGLEDRALAVAACRLGIPIVYYTSIVGTHHDAAVLSIDAYCDRERRYASAAPRVPGTDELVARAKKPGRRLLGTRPVADGLRALTHAVEWIGNESILRVLYRARLAAAIAQGVRDGERQRGSSAPAASGAAATSSATSS